MELKPYQQGVINDLNLFLEQLQQTNGRVRDSFYNYWFNKGFRPFPGTVVEPYKNNVQDGGGHPVPHVCIKVPTAGGKTFIACNALRTIFDKIEPTRRSDTPLSANIVVWLVPSNSILQQTIQNLRNTNHPYRQKINSHFQHRVEVFDKQALLSGAGFNATAVQGQLSIIVMSFDSLRAKNKEDRKLYQENGNNISFATAGTSGGTQPANTDGSHVLEGTDETAVINVIRRLSPVVVVDESHNAESDLSVEMLRNLNPAFILDLTATPRKNSNIISFVDALELKTENMVKLPVIVYNQKKERTEVINSALSLQRRLELLANEERKQGGRYIRPIVLFQAQPKTAEDNQTFEKIKETLIKAGIPSDQIKIKTASIDELKGIDLLSSDCPVRYIITVNALKEGWDCPFAYILASLADRSSAVDVEQILGRVLRQPYVVRHKSPLLNLSYVLTASSKFKETLQNIVNGLNKAGFSARDYRVIDEMANEPTIKPAGDPLELFFNPGKATPAEAATSSDEIDPANIQYVAPTAEGSPGDTGTDISEIERQALDEAIQFDERVKKMDDGPSPLPAVLADLIDQYKIKDQFREQVKTIKLPQFYQRVSTGIFGDEEVLLKKEALLSDFQLRKADRNIDFGSVDSELYKVDLEEGNKGEYTPRFSHIDGQIKDALLANILPNQTRDGQIKSMTSQMLRRLGNFKPISDKDVEWYIRQVLEDLTEEQFQDLIAQEYSYTQRIKQKIEALTTAHAEKTFGLWLDRDKLFLRPSFSFPSTISPTETGKDLIKSLYVREGKINSFEEKVIDAIANLESVAFWTRNLERGRGFSINGFINHYPDFMIVTKRGKIILLETKGDHLDNTDTAEKIRLGNLWRSKAGNEYRYFMVFETKEVPGANTLADVSNTIREL